ncbi:hypothetical protein BV22DRAFT_711706 [Leucogyrophana mollusca]|uniref:Uncharacterized protein n=1 Tax=Leucogyrophana mollusca TaxID=85980 RepID=A0ACB8B851_9AGAM|nr:hypothetical protein BV22DRAFT_711706 [Leucogyrophana mollusca]
MQQSTLDVSSIMAGVFISTTVFLILSAQVWVYFRKSAAQDAVWIKAIVAILWVVQVLQMGMSSHMAYLSVETFDSEMDAAIKISVDWAIYVGTSSLTAFLVHVLFVRRLYLLGKEMCNSWAMALFVGAVTMTAQAFGFFSMAEIIKLDRSPSRNFDTLKAHHRLLKKLTQFCVQTGIITSLVAMVTVSIWAAAGFNTKHLFMSFPMGGLYGNCLLANFLARESYLNVGALVAYGEDGSEDSSVNAGKAQ